MSIAQRRGSRRATRGRKPVWPAPLEPIEGAIAEAAQGRDVVGQKHEAERKHPEAENRQDGEAPADDQAPAGRRAQREAGFLSHRVIACIRLGRRRRSRLNRRSGSV